jgi:hypothetical protein
MEIEENVNGGGENDRFQSYLKGLCLKNLQNQQKNLFRIIERSDRDSCLLLALLF